MMNDIEIKISKNTRMVDICKSYIGNDGENLQGNLIFTFKDEFVDGVARLEYTIDGVSNYGMLTKIDESYTIPIKSVITKVGQIEMQLVITEAEVTDGVPIFKSNVFYVYCNKSINAEIEEPETLPTWIEVANQKLIEIDNAIDEASNLDIDAQRVSGGAEVTITDRTGTSKTVRINDGSGAISDYEELSNKPKINGHELIGNQTGDDLGLNYDDTEIWESIINLTDSLGTEINNRIGDTSYLERKKQNITDNTLQTIEKTIVGAINEVNQKVNTNIYRQDTASNIWTITHNLGKYPSVSIVDSSGNSILGDIQYIDINNVKITFSGAFTGKAYLN